MSKRTMIMLTRCSQATSVSPWTTTEHAIPINRIVSVEPYRGVITEGDTPQSRIELRNPDGFIFVQEEMEIVLDMANGIETPDLARPIRDVFTVQLAGMEAAVGASLQLLNAQCRFVVTPMITGFAVSVEQTDEKGRSILARCLDTQHSIRYLDRYKPLDMGGQEGYVIDTRDTNGDVDQIAPIVVTVRENIDRESRTALLQGLADSLNLRGINVRYSE